MEQNNSCNSVYGEIIEISEEFVPISYQWWKDNRIMPALSKNRILGPSGRLILQMTHKNSKGTSASEVGQVPEETIPEELHLEPGEWVQVRSEEEIIATLDERGKYKGLNFMPEMKAFCGKKFRVFKRVERIMAESTGEIRRLRSPTVFLEGVYCDGKAHYGCDRSCFLYWREAWLRRINP